MIGNTIRILTFITCALLLVSTAQAADGPEKKSPLDLATEREVTIVRDAHGDDYLKPTLENLSRLYWKLGVFDNDDDVAVDNYLRINECGIYTNYSNDEFEWIEIRDAMRDRLVYDSNSISNKFKFVMPIFLGNYDPDRGGFDIIRNSGFPNLKRIEFVSPYSTKLVCNTLAQIPDYEKNILLILDEPLDYTFVEMDDHVAQAFILRKKYESENIDEEIRLRRYQRQAYIRIRMDIREYQGSIMGRTLEGNLAILYGILEGIDVFDDKEQKLLLASYSKEDLRRMREEKQAANSKKHTE